MNQTKKKKQKKPTSGKAVKSFLLPAGYTPRAFELLWGYVKETRSMTRLHAGPAEEAADKLPGFPASYPVSSAEIRDV